jgi:aminoglycoside phosphotransferase family enzyme/predicted kinase
VVQTHISVVFLVGAEVYKVKKPVRLDFVDFSTLEKRQHFCEEEVRLNRRLAPHVYRGVVPIVEERGQLRVSKAGPPIEWAVHMERLPDDAQLQNRLARGSVDAAAIARLAETLARFHSQAAGGAEIVRRARFDGVARNLLDILDLPAGHIGATVSRRVHERVRVLTGDNLARFHDLIEARAERGVPRDCHGDLHLDHIYLFPDRPPPDDLVIVDCIEFNERFRFIDPVADMAFVYMDLIYHGHADLAETFRAAYFAATGDREGETLLPLYTSYRAAVRGKVDGLKWAEPEVPAAEKQRAQTSATAHWLQALAALEEPRRRPCLLLVAGLPGAGKSTLARAIAERAGFEIIRTDMVRKELARTVGLPEQAGKFAADIYTDEWTERTYHECLHRARERIFEGERVIIDATFQSEHRRKQFLEMAAELGVPGWFLHCTAPADIVQERLRQRRHDVSDADWSIYQLAARRWEPAGAKTARQMIEIDTSGNGLAEALESLRLRKLA